MNTLIATSTLKALIVVTSHSELGNTGKPTGYYLPEVTHPAHALELEGITVDIASPKGGLAPMDESSRDLNDPINKKYLNNKTFMQKLQNTKALHLVNPAEYSAIIFAGGHGTMWDFSSNPDISRVSARIYESGGIVAAVCHGPAALLNIKLSNGMSLVEGKNVAAFSNNEEEAAGLTQIMPFLLETELVKKGAKYTSAKLWQKHVIQDGNLITGQNPASAEGVGQAVAQALKNLARK